MLPAQPRAAAGLAWRLHIFDGGRRSGGSSVCPAKRAAKRARADADHSPGTLPWDGQIEIELALERPADFRLLLRVPGWCRGATLSVNGVPEGLGAVVERGYARLKREWHPGDRVGLELAMPVERVYAHPEVRRTRGRGRCSAGR